MWKRWVGPVLFCVYLWTHSYVGYVTLLEIKWCLVYLFHVQELKPVVKEDDKAVKIAKDDINVEPEEKKAKVVPEEADSHKPVGNKERNIDLQLDLEKTDRESGSVSLSGNKPHVHVQNQKPHQQPSSEKNGIFLLFISKISFYPLFSLLKGNFFFYPVYKFND